MMHSLYRYLCFRHRPHIMMTHSALHSNYWLDAAFHAPSFAKTAIYGTLTILTLIVASMAE